MIETINQYKGKGVLHTRKTIEGRHYGFDEQGFITYQKSKESEYQLLERYFAQVKQLPAKRGPYGVEVRINQGATNGEVLLAYSDEGLVFTCKANGLSRIINQHVQEYNNGGWMVDVTEEEIQDVIDHHFTLSNYIKQYKTKVWVTLMVKVVEAHDFYEEFIQGMDKYSKLELLWNYTATGLTINHERDSFKIDDSMILLQSDRLQVMKDFFTFVAYIKTKYYQEEGVEDESQPVEEGATRDEQVSEGGVTGGESHTSGEELTEELLDELQAEEESNYLANLKKVNTDKPPTYQTVKVGVETEGLHPIKGNAFLSKLKSDLAVALIVYKDGEEIVNTRKQSQWVDGDKQYTDGIIKGVEAAIKKYRLGKVDIVFNRGTDEVKVRVGGGQPDEQQLIVQKGGSPSLDSHTILVPEQKDPASYILNWFEGHNGW